jgi:hypothetical protein
MSAFYQKCQEARLSLGFPDFISLWSKKDIGAKVALFADTNRSPDWCIKGSQDQGLYSQHFIFFVTYELAQYARVLHYSRLYFFQ